MKNIIKFKNSISRLLLPNFELKILSLVVTVFIFLLVRSEQTRSFNKTASIKIITSQHLGVVGPQTVFVDVFIKVNKSFLFYPPSSEQLQGFIDLSHEKPGIVSYRLSRQNFPNLPRRYDLFINQPLIEIEIDTMIEKKLPIKLSFIGETPKGYKILSTSIVPTHLNLFGPEKILKTMEHVYSEDIDIHQSKTDLNGKYHLDLPAFTQSNIKNFSLELKIGPANSNEMEKSLGTELTKHSHL